MNYFSREILDGDTLSVAFSGVGIEIMGCVDILLVVVARGPEGVEDGVCKDREGVLGLGLPFCA